jgi:hypothetical protein
MGATGDLTEPSLAFCLESHDQAAIEVRVNFGVYAGRNATQAEIDDLARTLHDVIESFTIVAEERHEFGGDSEAMLRQIVIEIDDDNAGVESRVLCDRVVARAEQWASACIAARSDLGELSDL